MNEILNGTNNELELERITNIAIINLIDELSHIGGKLEKACLLMQELEEEYFNKYDNKAKGDNLSIVYGYSRYGIYTSMISDYLYEAKKSVKTLKERRFAEEDI